MEQYELNLLAKYSEKDEELKRLWDEHVRYEKQLERYENKIYLTPGEELEVKELKKKKLAGKTRMHTILDNYKIKEES